MCFGQLRGTARPVELLETAERGKIVTPELESRLTTSPAKYFACFGGRGVHKGTARHLSELLGVENGQEFFDGC